MKRDHLAVVRDWSGEPIKQAVGTDEEGNPKLVDLTYRDMIVNALHAFEEDEKVLPDLKARIYTICTKLYGKSKQVDLTTEELTLIKERAGKSLSVLGYGRIQDWAEGKKSELDLDDASSD